MILIILGTALGMAIGVWLGVLMVAVVGEMNAPVRL